MTQWTTVLVLFVLSLPTLDAQSLHQVGDQRVEGKLAGRASSGRSGASQVTLLTPFGAFAMDADQLTPVQGVEIGALKDAYAARRREPAGDHRQLAQWCYDQGLWSGLLAEMNAVLEADMVDPWCSAIISDLATKVTVDRLEGSTRDRDRRKFVRILFESVAPRDNVSARMAAEKARALPPELTFSYAMDALEHRDARVRWLGAHLLADHREKSQRIQRLFRHSLLDRDSEVRLASAHALAVTDDEVFTKLYAKNLSHGHSGVRANAAEAMGVLGNKASVPSLIKALAAGASAPRNHISVKTSRAFIKDFDVEIAQGAVIADPVVDVVSEGVILDVRVVSVVEELSIYRSALKRLTGKDFGLDVDAWKHYWESR